MSIKSQGGQDFLIAVGVNKPDRAQKNISIRHCRALIFDKIIMTPFKLVATV